MAFFDMPLDTLRSYRPDVREAADFDAFWQQTIAEARDAGGEATVEEWDGPALGVEVFDVRFPGFNGEPVSAWLVQPAGITEPQPCVVQFLGYNGGRGLPIEHLTWATAGYVHLLVDSRGQGGQWSPGSTPDPYGSGPQVSGVMTKGIEDPATYYYRRFFTDGVRAVDFVRGLNQVDAAKVVVHGISQGGGAALAVGGLAEGLAGVISNVPFLCHYERATGLVDTFPYQELVTYLKTHRGNVDRVFETLSYFDGVNLAKRITAPTLMSVALMDATCPPSTVFAAANHIPSPPRMEVYPYNGHEGGQSRQTLTELQWLAELFS